MDKSSQTNFSKFPAKLATTKHWEISTFTDYPDVF